MIPHSVILSAAKDLTSYCAIIRPIRAVTIERFFASLRMTKFKSNKKW
jgi:hypothetical protein